MSHSSKGGKTKAQTHKTISMPLDLMNEVDILIRSGLVHGYRNRSEFCAEAVRLRVQQIKKDAQYDDISSLVDLFYSVAEREQEEED